MLLDSYSTEHSTSRFELKFFIHRRDAKLLATRLDKLLRQDSYSPYTVVSVYFDNFGSDAIWEKLGGDAIRTKFRLRTYRGQSTFKFEIKKRIYNKIHKDPWEIYPEWARLIVDREFDEAVRLGQRDIGARCARLIAGQESDEAARLAKDYERLWITLLCLRSRATEVSTGVLYQRQAWEWPFSDLRITIDSCLSSFSNYYAVFNSEAPFLEKPILPPHIQILEIKFNTFFPQAYTCIFKGIPKVHSAISKFVFCRMGTADLSM